MFCDSFFSSINLAKQLMRMNTYFTGTLRKNRYMPQLIKQAAIQRGESVYMRQGPVLAMAFREDKDRSKPVRLISTFYKAGSTNYNKPHMICGYNQFMGGVDLADMMLKFYENDGRRVCKVWKKMVLHVFSRILLNSYVLYFQNTSDRPILNRLEFNQKIIESLSSAYENRGPPARANNTRQGVNITVVPVQGQREKDCIVCSDRRNGQRKRSRKMCNRCNKGLHYACLARHVCRL